MVEKKTLIVEVTPRGIAEARRQLDELAGSGKKAETSVGDLAKRIAGWTTAADMAVRAGQGLLRGIGSLAKEAVVLAAGYEKARVTWGVLVGDMERGKEVFEELRTFAAETPLSFEAIEQAAQTLKGFGVETAELIPTLQRLGDMSRGDSSALGGLALVFGQIKAQGRAMTQDLYQFVNAGVPIFNLLADSLGVSAGEIKNLAAEGKIGFREIDSAIKKATDAGGQFHGMMEKTAETATGLWSTAVDNAKGKLAELGAELLGYVTPALKEFNERMDVGTTVGNIADAMLGEQTANVQKALEDVQKILELAASNRKEFEKWYVQGNQLGLSANQIITNYQRQLVSLQAMAEQARIANQYLEVSAARRSSTESSNQSAPIPTELAPWRKALGQATGVDATTGSGADIIAQYLAKLRRDADIAISFGEDIGDALAESQNRVRDAATELLNTGLFGEQDGSIQGLRTAFSGLGQEVEAELKRIALDEMYNKLRDPKSELIRLSWDEVQVKLANIDATQGEIAAARNYWVETKAQVELTEEAAAALAKYRLSINALEQAFAQAGMNAYVDVFKSFGEAMASGANAGESFAEAMANIGSQLLEQLPMLLLSAGLNAIAMGNLPVGLALVGASGLVAIGAGVASAARENITPNALGAAYSSRSLHTYANGIYTTPQFFGWEGSKAFANGGVFAEAGPEAIMPLARDSTGRLGVRANGASIQVIINNNADGTRATQSEGVGPNGEKQIVVTIESVVKSAFANGKMDGAMSRYGVRPQGVRT